MKEIIKNIDKAILKIVKQKALQSNQPDMDQPTNTSKDSLHVSNGPMTWSKTNTLKETLNKLVLKVSTKSDFKGPLEYQEEALIHLIHVQEGPIQPYLGYKVRRKHSKRNKRILLQLVNNISGYLFFLFLGLMCYMEGYK